MTLTVTRFTFTQTTKIEIGGIPQTETDSDQGTYSISGSTITINSDDPDEDVETATITANGSDMTIDTDDTTIEFKKQEYRLSHKSSVEKKASIQS